MKRRHMLGLTALAAASWLVGSATSLHAADSAASDAPVKKVLFFTKSAGWEHSVIKRENGKPSWAENILSEQGPKHHIEFTFSKDGSLFTPEYLAGFDAIMFYTTGDLTVKGNDGNPAMTPEGKQALLDAIKHGKGFVGIHSATDTFHTNEPGGTNPDPAPRYQTFGDKADPYIKMIGGEFIKHGAQQPSKLIVTDPKFPGAAGLVGSDWTEEWYSLKEFQPNLHVIAVNDTHGMKGPEYDRAPYPETWAQKYGDGRVFYTSLGHREDIWTNPKFQDLLFGGIAWATGQVDADVTPNLKEAAPGYADLPKQSPKK
jgi:type 1 glutamine amidotransferase